MGKALWVSKWASEYSLVFTLRVLSANHAVGSCRIQFHPQSTEKKLSPKDCSPFLLCDIDLNEGVIRQKITARGLAAYTHTQPNIKRRERGGVKRKWKWGTKIRSWIKKTINDTAIDSVLPPSGWHKHNPKGGVECCLQGSEINTLHART